MAKRAAIGIIRVSQRKGRGTKPGREESFVSPGDQRKRIKEACGKVNLRLARLVDEIDVSGATPLADREGLLEAVEAIEAGEASVLMVGYFDRLVRSIKVQGEVVSRVEAAGGEVLAVDYGRISEETAVQWLSGTLIGMVHEYHRRSTMERVGAAQVDAIERGVPTFPNLPPGLDTGEDGRLVQTADAPVALEAFEMRDPLRLEGPATLREIRAFLKDHGIDRSYHGVQSMLASRLYVGELHFGDLANLAAVQPIVPRDLFDRVQTAKAARGRQPKSTLLLARLGVLVCEDGARMVSGVQTQNNRRYPFYRCPTVGDCEKRHTIGAAIAEAVVAEAVRKRIAGKKGSASAARDARAAAKEADQAQAVFDTAIRTFAGLEGEGAARDRLLELREDRDEKVARAEHLANLHSALTVTATDWDRLSLGAKRKLIRATVDRAVVGPVLGQGRAAERITVHLFGE